jgi:organic radical activating enzyme
VYKSFVEFNLITGCPNTCKYCPQDVFRDAYNDIRYSLLTEIDKTPHGEKRIDLQIKYDDCKVLSMQNFVTMVNKLPKSTISIAGFSEPFMNPECTNMIEYAGKQGHQVIVYSTLQGMTIEDYQRMRKMYFIKSLVIHLPDKEGNMKTNISEEYKKLLKYIVSQPPGGWCAFDFSVHGSAVHPDIAHIVSVNPRFVIHDRAGCLKTDDLTVHRVHWKSGKILCGNGFGQYKEAGLILADGTVLACCMDWSMKHVYGNLMTQSWDEIMQSPVRKMLEDSRKDGADSMCRHCAESQMDFRG